MAKKVILSVIIIIIAAGIGDAQKDRFPSSCRSEEIISRIKPKLQKELSSMGLRWGAPVFIRIFKKEKKLELWLKDSDAYSHFKTFDVCSFGFRGLGPKLKKGDWKSPEGFYFVKPAYLNPWSNFHLAFNIGYPNQYDRIHGRTGSMIMVHGSCISIGCYAMRDKWIEEIYSLVDAALKEGQPFVRVHIFPFRMTAANMKAYNQSEWIGFWRNLKQGYDFFEKKGYIPPDVTVKDKRYVFG